MIDDTTLAGGTGQGFDASVSAVETPPDQAPTDEEKAAQTHQGLIEAADRHVAGAQSRVEKAQAHLDGANASLAEAQAEREALG